MGEYLLNYQADFVPAILDNIHEGITSSIKYEIKVFREGTGPFSLWGRTRVYHELFIYDGLWDPFSESFLIKGADESVYISHEDDFLKKFFSLDEVPVIIDHQEGQEYEILIRSELRSIKFLPPLNILSPFQNFRLAGSSWLSHKIESREE